MQNDSNISDALLERIRHLLAMADHPTSNEHEAAIALEKAQALLLEHNLTRATVATSGEAAPTPEGVGRIRFGEAHGYSWKSHLLHVTAINSLCRVIREPSDKMVNLFGTKDNVRVVLEMYTWIAEQLDKMCMRAWLEYKRSGGYLAAQSYKASWYSGATTTISERLRAPMETFRQGSGRDLVRLSDANLTGAVSRIFPNTHSSHRSTKLNEGYRQGRKDGANVKFARTREVGSGRLALGSGR